MLAETAGILVLGLVVLVAQVSIAPLMDIQGVHPDLLLVFVMAVTMRRGALAGLLTGFLTGLAQDSISLGFIGVLALCKSSVVFWIGVWLQRRESPLGPAGWFIVLTLASLVQDFGASLFLLQGSNIGLAEYFVKTVLPSSIYTGVFGFIWSIIPLSKPRGLRKSKSRTSRIEL